MTYADVWVMWASFVNAYVCWAIFDFLCWYKLKYIYHVRVIKSIRKNIWSRTCMFVLWAMIGDVDDFCFVTIIFSLYKMTVGARLNICIEWTERLWKHYKNIQHQIYLICFKEIWRKTSVWSSANRQVDEMKTKRICSYKMQPRHYRGQMNFFI